MKNNPGGEENVKISRVSKFYTLVIMVAVSVNSKLSVFKTRRGVQDVDFVIHYVLVVKYAINLFKF